MAKMFYTTEEAQAKLNASPDQLKQMVTDNKLREFRDGARVMFKVDQVDRLIGEAKGKSAAGASGIQLAPADSGGHDAISLSDSDVRTPAKEDTVVTSSGSRAGTRAGSVLGLAGGSTAGKAMVFDDTEIKAADAAAQTQIQPAVEDQLSLEGVGSGSGLLDLTRESDDTSLGAELLDEIYPGSDQKADAGIGSASGIFEQPVSPGGSAAGMMEESAPIAAPVMAPLDVVEEADSTSGAFGGMALAASLVMGVTLTIVGATYAGFSPDWVGFITKDNTGLYIFAGILVVVAGLFSGVGFFIGKATAR